MVALDAYETSQKNKIHKRSVTEEAIPLSFAQERLWFLSQLEFESVFYNEAGAIELVGKLDVHALERGLQEIVRRHEVLRTVFVSHEGHVRQLIAPELKVAIKYQDLQMLSAGQQIDAAGQGMIDEANQPFDLSLGPLIRFLLIQLAPEKHILVIVLHHIIADGWSVKILIHEFSAIYGAFCAGRSSSLPALPIQYADYTCWQRERLQDSVLNQQLAYWTEHLQGSPALLELPTDFPRPTKLKHLGAKCRFNISQETAVALNQLSRNHGVTLFMTLAAAYAILLSRYTHQKDICIGYPIVNRPYSELQVLMGLFANTLVLRVDLSGNPSFAELLGRVKKRCLEAQTHQDLPFDKLVEELAPERTMSHNPLFQVFLNQTSFDEQLRMSGIEMTEIEIEMGSSKFDLTLDVKETNGVLTGWFEYNIQLFKDSTIARWVGHFQQLLRSIVAIADQPISALLILSEQEREQLLCRWNATNKAYSHELCIHQLIEKQAELQPNSVAVVFEEQLLTYQQLNAKANQLARFLRAQGVGPEVLVGVCVERSVEMIVGLVATLKADGVYVPIDPRYPSEHIAHALEDAKPQIVLTQEALQGLLPAQVNRAILDVQRWIAEEENTDNLPSAISSQNLAYVIYTSGSTGKPKGVGVTHRNVVHSTLARLDYYQVPIDGFLLLSSIAFDSSIAGIFGTLCQGGQLVLSSQAAVLDPATLVSMISSQKISHLLTIPSLYESILQQITLEQGKSLKQVIVAGESCKKSLVALQSARLPHVELFNEYGPTEATVWSSVYHCVVNDDTVVPIGHPISNTRIFLLDIHLNPVPVGVIGELYIGGEGLARSYLNCADVTADRYIPDPFGESGSRLYRTGDLARYREDGNIEYVGRADYQVKIRGFRIELGGIESTLLQHPNVREAVVIAREDTPGNKRLVAYIVGDRLKIDVDGIRSYLIERLPGYMLPAAFVFLDQLPLSANRKIDRSALPAPDIGAQSMCQYVAPRTPTEENLAAIWAEVLELERIGIHDNFFELGGHSLLVIQVISRVYDLFSVDLPLHILFEKPVLEDFALEIDAARMEGQACEISPLKVASRNQVLPLSYAQERLWFLDQFEPGNTSYNMSGAVKLKGELDMGVLKSSLNEIIRRHEVLRTTFDVVNGKPRQVIAPSMSLEINDVDLRDFPAERRESEVRRYLEGDARRPFDLAQGPLVRATVFFLGNSPVSGEQQHILLVTLHHIVSDGWSTAILIREFILLYEAYRAGRISPLSELTIQYVDYAMWQREWLQGEKLQQQVGYWKKQLTGAPPILELPTDRPRPVVPSYRGATLYAAVPQSVTEQLKLLGRQQDVTLFMVLLAAFSILLSRYSGQSDLCVGTPIANRNRLEIEGLIGFFVNTQALRTDLSGNPTFVELLKRIKAVCLGAQAHQDLPFERLVEELTPVRNINHNPIFQVMFALQNMPETAFEITGLAIESMVVETGTAKFDLNFEMSEKAEGLKVQINYNTDLFDESTILRIAEHYRIILESIVHSPDQLLSEIKFLTEQEYTRLRVEWNSTLTNYPHDQSIHDLFEMQVEKSPDAVAVVFEEQQLTYRELNRKANGLARYLRTQGIGPEMLVGICVERSLEMLIGILGILKAGGAYLPIHPGYPKERINFVLEDARPAMILIHESTRGVVPEWSRKIDLSTEYCSTEWLVDENPSYVIDAQNLAYVIYTSGSTGKPKGSGLAHRGVVNRLMWMQRQYQLNDHDRVLQKTPFGFDVSVWEFFWPLLVGARLIMLSPGAHRDPVFLAEIIEQQQITTLHFVPSMLSVFLDSIAVLHSKSLRHVFSSGEALSASLQQQFFEKMPNTRLHNLYGPTEASIDVTYWACIQDGSDTTIPIGRPISNIQIYLLDAHLNPVPAGIAGELYIGGVGLARGYLNQPELTAERFIPDPLSETGGRLYRSGDIARYRNDGNIEYLGRTDHQVKIRGFRIELGEIEAILMRYQPIKEAVVLAREDMPGEKRLVAYITGNTPALNHDGIRAYLKAYLPDYMVPAAFVCLDDLPLSSNGKIDRKALSEPQIEAQFVAQYVAPRNEIEESLVSIWVEVLGVEKMGIHDDFFELGGHSLLVTQILSRIHAKFQINLPLRIVFEAATIALLADAIEIAQWKEVNVATTNTQEDWEVEDIAL